MTQLTLDYGIANVEMVVFFVSTHFGNQDGQIVVSSPLDTEAKAAVGLPFESNLPHLEIEEEKGLLSSQTDKKRGHLVRNSLFPCSHSCEC